MLIEILSRVNDYLLLFEFSFRYAIHLVRIDPDSYNPGNLLSALSSLVTTTFSLGQSLPFLKGNLIFI